MNLSNCCKGK